MTTRTRLRTPVLDAVAGGAEGLARAAAEDVGGAGSVGTHVGATPEGDRVVTHRFTALLRGYRDWQWAVTVVRASRSREVTISETVLLPSDGAVVAPAWVPWSERIVAGDVGVGDLLPAPADDPRLVPGYVPTFGPDEVLEEDPVEEAFAVVAYELGLGRERVLSPYGRDEAAARWYDGDAGPQAPVALAAPAPCATCGFLVGLGGPLRSLFGVCTNEWSPSDARVVSYDHGCGAHSQAAPELDTRDSALTVVDTMSFEPLTVDDGID